MTFPLFAIFIAALIGVPLFIIILASAGLGFYWSDIDLTVLPIELYRITDSQILMALPLFALTGFLLSEGKTADRLVKLSHAALGWLPGGVLLIALLTCAFFTMLTGGSGVTIIALGALLHPSLMKSGYGDKFSLGLITTSGSLGLLLPPAIPLILYGIVAQQMEIANVAITDLFIAGIIPALLMIVALYGYGLWANRHKHIPLVKFDFIVLLQSINAAKWELAIPLVIFVGVFSGVLVISDVAAVIALYTLFIKIFILKEVTITGLPKIMRETMVMVGGIILILGVSLAFTNYLVDAQVPEKVFQFVKTTIDNKYTFLILLNVFLLVLGAFLDIFAALVIMVPLILPVAINYGINPVHLGIIFVANMQIGYFTPPVGMNLFIASYRFKRSIQELYVATIPFMLVLLLVLMLITYVPELSLVLLN